MFTLFKLFVLSCLAYSQVSVFPTNIEFGQVYLHSTRSLSVRVTNWSKETIKNLRVQEYFDSNFYFFDDCLAELKPNQWCTINIDFRPRFTGRHSTRVSIDWQNGWDYIWIAGDGMELAPAGDEQFD